MSPSFKAGQSLVFSLGGVAGSRDGGFSYCGIFGLTYSGSQQIGKLSEIKKNPSNSFFYKDLLTVGLFPEY
jgi:hypothetical protein